MWTCPQCHTDVEPPFEACWNCGTWRDGESPPPRAARQYADRPMAEICDFCLESGTWDREGETTACPACLASLPPSLATVPWHKRPRIDVFAHGSVVLQLELPEFCLAAGLMLFLGKDWAPALLVALGVHELGHALAAAWAGRSSRPPHLAQVYLNPDPAQLRRVAAVAIAGPAANLLVAAASGAVHGGLRVDGAPAPGPANLWLGVISLVPLLPLDGGRALAGVTLRSLNALVWHYRLGYAPLLLLLAARLVRRPGLPAEQLDVFYSVAVAFALAGDALGAWPARLERWRILRRRERRPD